MLIWLSAGDHGLYTPDEGRYGVIALHMTEGGSWLMPKFEGEVHLTKPPLEYWAIAVSIKLLGRVELAARLPSLLAGVFSIFIVLGLSRRIGGPRVAALSVGTLSLMPLFIIMNRLATTDSMLDAFWMAALACGFFAVHPRASRTWTWLMWLAVAAGLMTKGPLALAPVGIILLWLALARRWSDIKRLHLFTGFLLALTPLATWVFFVILQNGDALQIWRHEIIDRATGSGAHPEPWWYYLPIFLGALFPATAMMMLPWWNVTPRRIVQELRSGSAVSLLLLAVLIPFICFSLMSGKLASYLLPMCGPLAILNGLMLEHWIKGAQGRTTDGLRLPDVRITLTICITISFLVFLGAALWFSPWLASYLFPTAMLVVACAWLCHIWMRKPQLRAVGLVLIWGVWMVNWWVLFELEDELTVPRDPTRLVQRLQDLTGQQHPTILTFGFTDPTLSFYSDSEVLRLRPGTEAALRLEQTTTATIVLVDESQWDNFEVDFSKDHATFEDVGVWHRNALKDARILRRLPSKSAAVPDNGA